MADVILHGPCCQSTICRAEMLLVLVLQPLFSSSGRPISAKRHWDDFASDSDEDEDFDWADEGAHFAKSVCQ